MASWNIAPGIGLLPDLNLLGIPEGNSFLLPWHVTVWHEDLVLDEMWDKFILLLRSLFNDNMSSDQFKEIFISVIKMAHSVQQSC